MRLLENYEILLYFFTVVIYASTISYIKREDKCLVGYLRRIAEGILSAYITYELSYLALKDSAACLAVSSLGAWFGIETLTLIKESLQTYVTPRRRY